MRLVFFYKKQRQNSCNINIVYIERLNSAMFRVSLDVFLLNCIMLCFLQFRKTNFNQAG